MSHSGRGFRVEAPPRYSVVEQLEQGLVLQAGEGEGDASVAVTVVAVGPGAELDTLVERALAAHARRPGSARLIDRRPEDLGELSAVRTTSCHEVEGDLITVDEWRGLAGERLAMISASCTSSTYHRNADDFEAIAASLSLEAEGPPAKAGPRFDPTTGLLLVSDAGFAILRLAAGGELSGDEAQGPEAQALRAVDAIESDRPHPALVPALSPVVEPALELAISRNRSSARAWLGAERTCLLLPVGGELSRMVVAPAPRLPDLLADIVGLGPRQSQIGRETLTLDVPALAQLIAAERSGGAVAAGDSNVPENARQALLGLQAHWRVEARLPGEQGGEMVEVLDAASGLWLVVPRGQTVELHPTDPAHVWRELTHLVAPDLARSAGAAGA